MIAIPSSCSFKKLCRDILQLINLLYFAVKCAPNITLKKVRSRASSHAIEPFS